MEKSVTLSVLCVGFVLLDTVNSFPIDISSVGEGASTPLWLTNYFLTGFGFFLIIVTIIFGCVCCRNGKGFKEFRNSNANLDVPRPEGFVNPTLNSELTIFPPLGASANEICRFEPLPDIKAPNLRPAAFSYTEQEISSQDWFFDPYNNFPRNQLKYVQEYGRGWFGRVVEGEAQNITPEEKVTKVMVKILHEDATPTDHMYFLHEVKFYRDLKHPNILRLLGRCLETEPFLVILECYPNGDLKTFLSQNLPSAQALVEQGVTLQMCSNITSGLQFMHDNKFIHTDLAARNCLVGPDLSVKIGDYGNSIEIFKSDYYCAGSVALPIRWCAPETLKCTDITIETREVTPPANIWSLGVVFWEICEFCKLPYAELNDDQVIVRVLGEKNYFLEKPNMLCLYKDEMYHLMKLCWKSPVQRPTASQIYVVLHNLISSSKMPQKELHADSKRYSQDFEQRWQNLKPNSIPKKDNAVKPDHSPPVECSNLSAKLKNAKVADSSYVDSPLGIFMASKGAGQESPRLCLKFDKKPIRVEKEPGHEAPAKSGDVAREKANVTSADVTAEPVAKVEFEYSKEPEVNPVEKVKGSEQEVDSWLKGVEINNEEDESFVRKISEAIRDLDETLALEKTSSSEENSGKSSRQNSPGKDAKEANEPVVDFKLGNDTSSFLNFTQKSFDIASLQNTEQPQSLSFTDPFNEKKNENYGPESLIMPFIGDKCKGEVLDESLRENDSLLCGQSRNSSDTDDEIWRRRIEKGEISEKVKEKSKSIANLMILTHIDSDDSDIDFDKPFEKGLNRSSVRRSGSFAKSSLSSNNFGSENDLTFAVLEDEFKESLKKLTNDHKEHGRFDSLGVILPSSANRENVWESLFKPSETGSSKETTETNVNKTVKDSETEIRDIPEDKTEQNTGSNFLGNVASEKHKNTKEENLTEEKGNSSAEESAGNRSDELPEEKPKCDSKSNCSDSLRNSSHLKESDNTGSNKRTEDSSAEVESSPLEGNKTKLPADETVFLGDFSLSKEETDLGNEQKKWKQVSETESVNKMEKKLEPDCSDVTQKTDRISTASELLIEKEKSKEPVNKTDEDVGKAVEPESFDVSPQSDPFSTGVEEGKPVNKAEEVAKIEKMFEPNTSQKSSTASELVIEREKSNEPVNKVDEVAGKLENPFEPETFEVSPKNDRSNTPFEPFLENEKSNEPVNKTDEAGVETGKPFERSDGSTGVEKEESVNKADEVAKNGETVEPDVTPKNSQVSTASESLIQNEKSNEHVNKIDEDAEKMGKAFEPERFDVSPESNQLFEREEPVNKTNETVGVTEKVFEQLAEKPNERFDVLPKSSQLSTASESLIEKEKPNELVNKTDESEKEKTFDASPETKQSPFDGPSVPVEKEKSNVPVNVTDEKDGKLANAFEKSKEPLYKPDEKLGKLEKAFEPILRDRTPFKSILKDNLFIPQITITEEPEDEVDEYEGETFELEKPKRRPLRFILKDDEPTPDVKQTKIEQPFSPSISDKYLDRNCFDKQFGETDKHSFGENATVIVGACDDYTLDYFRGLKTTSEDLNMKNEYENDEENLDVWDKHLEKAFTQQLNNTNFDDISFRSFGLDPTEDQDGKQTESPMKSIMDFIESEKLHTEKQEEPIHTNLSVMSNEEEYEHFKLRTPDDERSSDSGFRDKGSLSESVEDACEGKYNLEDIEAELEEAFVKGAFGNCETDKEKDSNVDLKNSNNFEYEESKFYEDGSKNEEDFSDIDGEIEFWHNKDDADYYPEISEFHPMFSQGWYLHPPEDSSFFYQRNVNEDVVNALRNELRESLPVQSRSFDEFNDFYENKIEGAKRDVNIHYGSDFAQPLSPIIEEQDSSSVTDRKNLKNSQLDGTGPNRIRKNIGKLMESVKAVDTNTFMEYLDFMIESEGKGLDEIEETEEDVAGSEGHVTPAESKLEEPQHGDKRRENLLEPNTRIGEVEAQDDILSVNIKTNEATLLEGSGPESFLPFDTREEDCLEVVTDNSENDGLVFTPQMLSPDSSNGTRTGDALSEITLSSPDLVPDCFSTSAQEAENPEKEPGNKNKSSAVENRSGSPNLRKLQSQSQSFINSERNVEKPSTPERKQMDEAIVESNDMYEMSTSFMGGDDDDEDEEEEEPSSNVGKSEQNEAADEQGKSSKDMGTEDSDTADWQSESSEDEEMSSSSGEFIWKDGNKESKIKAECATDFVTERSLFESSQNEQKVQPQASENTLVDIIEEGGNLDEEDDEDDDNESSTGSSASITDFVPSAWNSQATPSRSALRSPDKKSDKQKKNVWFKKQKYHCVYEYPREPSDSEDVEGSPFKQSNFEKNLSDAPMKHFNYGLTAVELPNQHFPYGISKVIDFSTFTDWDVVEGEDPDLSLTDTDSETGKADPKKSEVNFYNLSPFDYDFNTADLHEGESEFFVSSSSRPFQGGSSTQFLPGSNQFNNSKNNNGNPESKNPKGETLNSRDFVTPDSGIEDSTNGTPSEKADSGQDDDVLVKVKNATSGYPKPGILNILDDLNYNFDLDGKEPGEGRGEIELEPFGEKPRNGFPETPSAIPLSGIGLGELRHARGKLKLDLPRNHNTELGAIINKKNQ